MVDDIWTTEHEAAYLRRLAGLDPDDPGHKNLKALNRWLYAATHFARDWGEMDAGALIGLARKLLRGTREV